jgi:acyl carrier protein
MDKSAAMKKDKLPLSEIENFIMLELSILLNLEFNKIDKTTDFEKLGLDSITAAQISGKLSELVGSTVYPDVLYDFNSIERLSKYIDENF